MHALHPIHLHQHLQIISHAVAGIQTAVRGWLVADPEQLEEFGLVDADCCADLGEAFVALVAGLVDDVYIVEGLGFVEECLVGW